MARLNRKSATVKNVATTPISTTGNRVVNQQGGIGWERTPKSELFLAAVTSLNEDTFYESAEERADRISKLLADPAVVSDGEWLVSFVGWLRREVGLRTVSAQVAVEAVHARLEAGISGGNRDLIAAAIGRLDEASELISYWRSRYGRKLPSALKRGVADGLNRYANEGAVLKWRGRMESGGLSLANVLNLVHPKPRDERQAALYNAVLTDAYGRVPDLENLPVWAARKEFLQMGKAEQIARLSDVESADELIRRARLTHEVIAGAIGSIPAQVWESLIPHLGYHALRMNLRRMSEAGISEDAIDAVNRKLRDHDAIVASKVMPIDFFRAYRNAPLDFAAALQKGANAALENVPELPGRTLVLLDCSGSMSSTLSSASTMRRQEVANIFAAAIALKNKGRVDVVAYNTRVEPVNIAGTDLLRVVDTQMPSPRGGTNTAGAVRQAYNDHDRVIILTDEQNGYYYGEDVGSVLDEVLKPGATAFTWNLAGYSAAHSEAKPGRWTFGGLSDKGFSMIPLLERGFSSVWPWEADK